MNIPDKIKIGGLWWKIKEVSSSEIDCDDYCAGDQSDQTQTIRIDRALSPEMKEAVLLHEIIHCINGQLDHSLVEMLALSLYQVFKENDLCPA